MAKRMPALTRPKKRRALPNRKVVPESGLARRSVVSRLRILPLTMVMALLLCTVKMTSVYQGGREIQLQMQQASAQAEPQAAPRQADEEKAAKAPPANTPDVEEEAMKVAKLQQANDDILDKRSFSQIEVDLLQSLRERRQELEDRGRELDLKEKLLEGTELRINDKLSEMKNLEQQVSALLDKYSQQEEQHIRSLVKIYENMKPKSAATIFNELELPILLEVIDEMSERKVAPILAAMEPMKAKEVTTDLAEMRKLKPLPVMQQ